MQRLPLDDDNTHSMLACWPQETNERAGMRTRPMPAPLQQPSRGLETRLVVVDEGFAPHEPVKRADGAVKEVPDPGVVGQHEPAHAVCGGQVGRLPAQGHLHAPAPGSAPGAPDTFPTHRPRGLKGGLKTPVCERLISHGSGGMGQPGFCRWNQACACHVAGAG